MAEKIVAPQLITSACEMAGIKYSPASKDGVVIKIHLPKKDHLVVNFNLGLVDSSVTYICKDKSYQIELLKNAVNFPKTTSYLDPQSKYGQMAKISTLSEIAEDIKNNFSLPVIVKMNQGSEGRGVFLCQTFEEIKNAVNTIFSHQNWEYDYVLLAQQYIKPKAEYRAIFYKDQLEILYLKDNAQSTFTGNLSPLHFSGAQAVEITDSETKEKIEQFIQPIFSEIKLKYAGFDIIIDEHDGLWLIEINSSPAFAYFLQNNPAQKVIHLFYKIFSDLKNEK
ncbi:ATP-grasp domain-containing protein [Patescibacteria group bacterium]|nr:ATP-grasp domain-containing protein [Patescibacteria group bacterium]